MVGDLCCRVNRNRCYAVREIGADEDKVAVQLRCTGTLFLIDAERRRMRGIRMRAQPGIGERRRSVVMRRDHARVQRIGWLEIEIAGDDRRRRAAKRVERSAVGLRGARILRVNVTIRLNRAQRLHLRSALLLRIVFEVRGDDANISERRGHDRFDGDAGHTRNSRIDRIGQQVPVHLLYRQA